MRFISGGLRGLPLEVEQLNNLWFATTQFLKNYSKPKRSNFYIINP